jgi:hypothetical protein
VLEIALHPVGRVLVPCGSKSLYTPPIRSRPCLPFARMSGCIPGELVHIGATMLVIASLYSSSTYMTGRSPLCLRPRPHPHVPPVLRAPPPPVATHQTMTVVLMSGILAALWSHSVAGPYQPAQHLPDPIVVAPSSLTHSQFGPYLVYSRSLASWAPLVRGALVPT